MHYRLGQYIATAAEKLGRRVVVIASGNLSHKLKEDGPYGFAPEWPEFDCLATEALGNGDFSKLLGLDPDFCESAAECGLRSFWIMAGTLDRKAVKSSLVSYEGPFGVGYGVIVQNGARRGLLLPDLDGVETTEKQIAIARRKTGIGSDEPVHLWRFKAVRHI